MRFSKKKLFSYFVLTLSLAFFVNKYGSTQSQFRFMETSLLTILKNVAEDRVQEPADLAIEKATLFKIDDPKESLNYYRYKANLVIANYGSDLKSANVTLSGGEDQKNIFLQNDGNGFSLKKDARYIVEDYEVIFDGDYNVGNFNFKLEVTNEIDPDETNNSYEYEIFELPPKLEAVGIENILEDGMMELTFDPVNFSLNTDDFQVLINDVVEMDNEEEKYDEILIGDRVYGFHRIKTSKEIIDDPNWKIYRANDEDIKSIKFSDDPFGDKSVHYFYFKAINSFNGNYAVSNIIKINPQKELSRADFAKYLVDFAEIEIFDSGENYFTDVSVDAWYFPYVQTLYNLGLIKNEGTTFNPDELISRANSLRVVMDYFDVDLLLDEEGPHFEDVDESHYLYPYIESLYQSGGGSVFHGIFNSELPATKNYLKYLVNEYKKDS